MTIFGQSAGAEAVRSLLSTGSARGLFHRAIMQSAGCEHSAVGQPWTFARTQAVTERLMQRVGAKTINDLRKTPVDVLRDESQALSGVAREPGVVHTPADLVWVTVPDELVEGAGFPGWASDVPVLFGCTENEARYFIKPKGPDLPFPKNVGLALLNLVKPGGVYGWNIVERIATTLCGEHSQQILSILRASGKTPYECLDWLVTSLIWREPLYQTTQRFTALKRRFYCYNFAHVAPGARISRDLAKHTSEIRYVFGNLTTDGYYDEADRQISDAMLFAWSAFARTGMPLISDGSAWPVFDAHAPQYMSIEDALTRRPYATNELVRVIASMRTG